MNFLVFLLASYGTTNVLTAGRLFAGLREFVRRRSELAGYWARCPMCLGVPVGIAWRLLGIELGTGLNLVPECLAAGAVSSGWCWILRVILHALGEDDL